MLRCLLVVAALAGAGAASAAELVRVRVSQFAGDEPLSLSSDSHPELFILDPSIASATLTAENGILEVESDGPATWFPLMGPPSVTPPGGTIELTIEPADGTPASPGLIRFRTEALFSGNPSSFVLASSLDGFAASLLVIDLAAPASAAVPVAGAPTEDPIVFRWSAGDDFGENGGGNAGFSGEDIVVATAPCPAAPAPGCEEPGRASLSLAAGDDPARRRLAWSWSRGTADAAHFDDPSQSSLATLCLYDDRGFVLAAGVDPDPCGEKRCWKAQRAGFAYKNKAGGTSGIQSLKLKAGDGKASIKLKGAGPLLELPLPMDADSGVRVQLVNSVSAACFESVFPAPAEVDEEDAFEDALP